MEDKKIIAEFQYPEWEHPKLKNADSWMKTDAGELRKLNNMEWDILSILLHEDYERLAYDLSWNMLIPVIEKIRDCIRVKDYQYTVIGSRWESIKIALLRFDVKATYNEVLNFIKWYNEQEM